MYVTFIYIVITYCKYLSINDRKYLLIIPFEIIIHHRNIGRAILSNTWIESEI